MVEKWELINGVNEKWSATRRHMYRKRLVLDEHIWSASTHGEDRMRQPEEHD